MTWRQARSCGFHAIPPMFRTIYRAALLGMCMAALSQPAMIFIAIAVRHEWLPVLANNAAAIIKGFDIAIRGILGVVVICVIMYRRGIAVRHERIHDRLTKQKVPICGQ